MVSYALVKSMLAPLTEEPPREAERRDEVLCGMRLAVLNREGEWYQVRAPYRYEGWVHSRHLVLEPDRLSLWEILPKKVVWQNYADVLALPKVQGPPVAQLVRGSLVSPVGKPLNGWQKIQLCDGTEGYLWQSYLEEYRTDWSKLDEGSLRRQIIAAAMGYLGAQYRWGGKTPLGIDCSGLCSIAYLLNGIVIYRDAEIRGEFPVRPILLERIQPADLLYFPGHMALYLGDDRYLHATSSPLFHGVTINSLDPRSPDYRADLPQKLIAVGSVF